MTWYAVLNGGVIVGRRQIDDWANYPAHKKSALDERGDGGPTLRPIEFVGESGAEIVAIEMDRVVITRSPIPPPDPPVEVISVPWLKAALAQIGKLAAVNAVVTDPVKKALWDSATEMRRDDPDMITVATALSIDLDDLWARAKAIRAARLPS